MRVESDRRTDGVRDRAAPWLAAMAATMLLAGCTVFAEDEPEPATIQAETDNSQFPTVGEVPDEAPPTTSAEERSVMLQQLQADQASAGLVETEGQAIVVPGANGQPIALIYFQNGSASLSEDDRSVIQEVAELQRASGGVIQIVGHASMAAGSTDPATNEEANYDISLARANAVANALLREGIDSANVQVAAAGSTEPEYYEFTPTGEAGNRRAEIYLVQ
jgi:outer membrane protein OmpA-like peptidoglycan-associated protein